jgi:hypothetical protein
MSVGFVGPTYFKPSTFVKKTNFDNSYEKGIRPSLYMNRLGPTRWVPKDFQLETAIGVTKAKMLVCPPTKPLLPLLPYRSAF